MHGECTVEIVLSEDALESVEVLSQSETPMVSDLALKEIPEEMVERQSVDVDSVSGSTVTSAAIKMAVKNALKEANADPANLANLPEEEIPQEDRVIETEVAVIGGGGAGLAAAVSAAELGAKVTIIEKMPRLGGNTLICGCLMNAYDEEAHAAAGDDVEAGIAERIEWTYKGGNEEGDMDLITRFVTESGPTFRWLRDEIGIEFYEDDLDWYHMPVEQNGVGFIRPLQEKAEALGVESFLNAKAVEILTGENAEVTGVVAETPEGKLTVMASKGVILSTGGCASNFAMVHELDDRYDDIRLTTNGVSSTGEGFALAEEIGADTVNMNSIQAVPFASPGTGQVDYGLDTANTIFVNSQGKHFMDEESKRDVAVAAIREQDSIIYYSIGDAKDWPTMDTVNGLGYTIGQVMEDKKCYVADTLEELAEMIKVDADTLIATVDEYNRMVENAEDTLFGREDMASRQKIDTPPSMREPGPLPCTTPTVASRSIPKSGS